MTSLTIPAQWLNPQKHPQEWIFRCSTTLNDLVKTGRAASYFRQLVTLLEDDNQIINYHLKLRHNFNRNHELDVHIYFDSISRTSNPPIMPVCISCEPTHELSKTSLLSEQQYTRAWLDGRAREKLILTPIRHVERLSELIDENGEMEAFWYDAIELIDKEYGQHENFYPNMILNHGTYRNHAHLHLKINFTKAIWDKIIAPRHHDRILQIKQLLQDKSIVNDCLSKDDHQKKTYSTKPHKYNHDLN
ncbi:unnamed protein product [Adineta steineri]|uniref:HIT domain-containing protein n=1 Tax=Adineta steineri TaxID=433720 RepID=A0A813T332_9BILA|nr:unnamed protein product [Adineta steineri]CAF0815490.1 unnamed protein product [Adineta steineri]